MVYKNNILVHRTYFQKQMEAADSTLQLFRKAITLRQHPSFLQGSMHFGLVDAEIFSFVRRHQNQTVYLVAMNIGKQDRSCNFSKEGASGKVVLKSPGISHQDGEVVGLKSLKLKPGHAIVLEIVPGSTSKCAIL